jgi:hypothetical protein
MRQHNLAARHAALREQFDAGLEGYITLYVGGMTVVAVVQTMPTAGRCLCQRWLTAELKSRNLLRKGFSPAGLAKARHVSSIGMKRAWKLRRSALLVAITDGVLAAWADPERKAARLKKYAETVAKKRLP